jgi:nucleoid-associated protein YgaU
LEEVVSSHQAKLQAMSVKELKAEGTKRNVDLSGCVEKSDLVAHLSAAYAAAKAGKLARDGKEAQAKAAEAKAAEAKAAEAKAAEAKAAEAKAKAAKAKAEAKEAKAKAAEAKAAEAKAKAKAQTCPRKIVAGVRNCNVPLMCPYGEKDDVKQLGGRWNNEERQWYVPAGLELAPFSRWNAEAFTYLRFAWRDEALRSRIKAQGAEYDGKTKLWYVRGNTDLRPFAQWRI